MSKEKQAKLFKVICSDWNGAVRGRPYRNLAVDPDASLAMLAEDILDAFDFDMNHMYGFYNNLKDWTRATEGYELIADLGEGENFPGTTHTPISQAFHTLSTKCSCCSITEMNGDLSCNCWGNRMFQRRLSFP